MNDLPADSPFDASTPDPLVETLRALQPAQCDIDAAALFYRSGYAAAVAQRRGAGVPRWALAASLLLVAGLAALVGFVAGDSATVRPSAMDRVVSTSPPAPGGTPRAQTADPEPPLALAESAVTAAAAGSLPTPESPSPPADDPPPLEAVALDPSLPLWSRWFGWQWLDPGAAAAIDAQLTIRPTDDQLQQLVQLRMPSTSYTPPNPPAVGGPSTIDGASDQEAGPMLSSMATEAVLRSLIH